MQHHAKNIHGTTRRMIGGLLCVVVAALLAAGPVLTFDPRPARAAHVEDGALDDFGHYTHLETERIRWKWVASWMKMTQQYTANMMHQMWIAGMFLDAKQQLETHRLFQTMLNQAHKDYHPSDQMCRFGTNIRSAAATEERAKVNAQAMSTLMLKRELLTERTAAAGGTTHDKISRIRQFKLVYCNIHDNNGRLARLCRLRADRDGMDFTRGAPDQRTNRDIDYAATIDSRYTYDINFTDNNLSNDEADVIALSRNLFSHDVFKRIPENVLNRELNDDDYLDVRSIIAIRGLARNSFGHIIGQRASGSGASAPFIKRLVEELGAPQAEIDAFLGETPSYFAQMEVLTRKMYQNPSFYATLYTKPENIKRAAVSMQAIKLMQDRDRFESALRREILLSGILELKLRTEQSRILDEQQNYQPFSTSGGAPPTPPTPSPTDCTGGWLDCL